MRALISGASLAFLALPFFSVGSVAGEPVTEAECLALTNTALERLYCRVKAGGEGSGLPDLDAFRKNSEVSQKEILWGPARRLGLRLPGEKPARPPQARALPMGIRYAPPDDASTSAQARANMIEHSGPLSASALAASAVRTQPKNVQQPRGQEQSVTHKTATRKALTQAAAKEKTAKQVAPASVSKSTQHERSEARQSVATSHRRQRQHQEQHRQEQQQGPHCALRGVKISCGSTYYHLAVNRPKHALSPSALGQANRLELPQFKGDVRDEGAVRDYLKRAYASYIDKMLGLGLAGSTMSFTTFYYSFKDQTQRNVDFANRFTKMFEFLKVDRQKLAVSTAKPDELPQSLGQCATLTSDIIVCDNAKKNWVYVRQKTL